MDRKIVEKTFYNEQGKIINQIVATENEIANNLVDGCFVADGLYDYRTHWFDNHELSIRPQTEELTLKNQIVDLSGLPLNTEIVIINELEEVTTFIVDQQDTDLIFGDSGQYKVIVKPPFPYVNSEYIFNA